MAETGRLDPGRARAPQTAGVPAERVPLAARWFGRLARELHVAGLTAQPRIEDAAGMHTRAVRIAVAYKRGPIDRSMLHAMDVIRWLRVAEALADLGFEVDLIADGPDSLVGCRRTLRAVPWERADWSRYDVIKTLFHAGFLNLVEAGGVGHPFILSKLGSVVGPSDLPGVHFLGEERQALWEVQEAILRHARCVTVLTEPSRALWEVTLGQSIPLLLVPTGVDRRIPPPMADPYPATGEKVVVYIGTLYQRSQREVNLLWQERLNARGHRLRRRRLRLYVVGPGRTDRLDPDAVVALGPVANDRIWDYHYFADVGLALAQGPVQHNESSKLYYYLRAGLPVVSEAPIPNNRMLEEAGCGLIAPYGDDATLAEMVEASANDSPDRARGIRHVLASHTWDHRVQTYAHLLETELGT